MKVKTSIKSTPKERLYKEWGMTKEGVARDLETIKTWLMKQPHLPNIQTGFLSNDADEWLENILIFCKNSIEKVKDSLDMYFTSRVLLPELFTNRDPLSHPFQLSFRNFYLGLTPDVSSAGERFLVFSHAKPTAEDFDPLYVMKRCAMMTDIVLQENIQHLGIRILIDFRNVCMSQIGRYNVAFSKRAIDNAIKTIPHRIRGIHLIQPASYIELSITLLKQVMSKKLHERIIIHKDPEELLKTVDPRIVPADFGGEAPTITQLSSLWEEKSIAYRDWFLSTETIKSDESKRLEKCRFESNTDFGFQGSFRKIEVD